MRQPVSAATGSFIAVDRNHKISGSLREVTIAEALKKIGEKIPLRVEGSPPVDQVGLQLQHLTLDETLRKIMRGYNYVLLDPGSSGVAVLTIMGRIERSQSTAGHSGPEPNPGQTSSHGSNTHPEPANSQLIPSNAQDPDRSSEHPPGPPTAVPGASNGGAAPAQNESEGTIADGPGSSSNSESAPSKDGDAQNSGESDNGSPPLSFLRKSTLDSYFNTERS